MRFGTPMTSRTGTSRKTVFFLLSTATLTLAAAPPSPVPSAPRTVVVLERGVPPVIRCSVLESTLFVLPEEEKVMTVFSGDTDSWVYNAGKLATRFLSIKPKVAGLSTDVHIISDHRNEYTLELLEVSGETDSHFDAKVFLTPGDQPAQEHLMQLPVFIPAAEAQAKLDRLEKEAAADKAAATNERKVAAAQTEQYRSTYPGRLHFDYVWNRKAGEKLGVKEIWRDDKFTYLRGHFPEPPALYELKDGKDGKGSLINFDFANGLYTIPKTVEQGYLSIGKQRMDFHRVEERN